jgi:hypothetical protein
LGQATGKHPATIRKRLSSLSADSKGKYDSVVALEAIYCGLIESEGTFVSTPEAVRQLTIAKKEEIDLEMEIKRGERIPVADCLAIDNEVFQSISGTLKANAGKHLTEDVTNEIFDGLKQWVGRLNGNGNH